MMKTSDFITPAASCKASPVTISDGTLIYTKRKTNITNTLKLSGFLFGISAGVPSILDPSNKNDPKKVDYGLENVVSKYDSSILDQY